MPSHDSKRNVELCKADVNTCKSELCLKITSKNENIKKCDKTQTKQSTS